MNFFTKKLLPISMDCLEQTLIKTLNADLAVPMPLYPMPLLHNSDKKLITSSIVGLNVSAFCLPENSNLFVCIYHIAFEWILSMIRE